MVESILLYYCYVDLRACREAVHAWFIKLCEDLQLKGRVRVAFDGINVTVCAQFPRLSHFFCDVCIIEMLPLPLKRLASTILGTYC